MSAHESEKALRYIGRLDNARCNADWSQVPELARKVEKHAPRRKCLALVARSEAQVATYIAPDRPPTAASESTRSPLTKLISPLLSAIDGETQYPEDKFQAVSCLGWIHWTLGEPGLATARLPKNVAQALTEVAGPGSLSTTWVQVCAVRGAYIKGFAQEKTGHPLDGLETYKSMLPFLASIPALGALSHEFRLWTERLLCRTAAVSTNSSPLGDRMDLGRMLQMFHLWTSLSQATTPNQKPALSHETTTRASSPIDLGQEVEYSRWDVWMAYYRTLSYILQKGFIYAPSYTKSNPKVLHGRLGITDDEFLKVRLLQRAELKVVETSIESKLLDETRFPRSNERNERVERWVDAVMSNWRIMCGPTWQDDELGEGGKNAIARGVLDTLYRAATKSYHSTQILRHLFTVHSYVAEFDLAFKAFDSYIDIVQRGRSRAEKGGEIDFSLDGDETVLNTAVEAIKILCRFGQRKDAERAEAICKRIHRWLQDILSHMPERPIWDSDSESYFGLSVSPRVISTSYYALGLNQATWSRLTFDPSDRTASQNRATEFFRSALDARWSNSNDLDISFAWALVLAEMRDIAAAIKVVKQALAQSTTKPAISPTYLNAVVPDEPEEAKAITFIRERKLIPFWHLLALLLTAKSDPKTASQACDAAFEQFHDPENLFGPAKEYRSEHLNDGEILNERPRKALVDLMERSEKVGIVQVKITQLALMEALEGPTAAVDCSADLLALYARLFGDPGARIAAKAPTAASLKPPKSAIGTLRNSILSRARSRSRKPRDREKMPLEILAPATRPSTRATTTTAAPTIEVTDEDGSVPQYTNGQQRGSQASPRVEPNGVSGTTQRPLSTRRHSSRLRKRSGSMRRRSEESARPESTLTANDPIPIADATANGVGSLPVDEGLSLASQRPSTAATSVAGTDPRSSFGQDQPLRKIPHNFHHHKQTPPSGHDKQPPKQDVRLPAPYPTAASAAPQPRFPALQERRHKISLLVDIWLFISGLYIRATMIEDASGACDEAFHLIRALESEVALEKSSAKAFEEKGWGIGKSVEELWADAWAQRAEVARASDKSFDAQEYFEKALAHSPDHPEAVVGLAELLLDVYCQKIPHERPEHPPFSAASPESARMAQLESSTNGNPKNGEPKPKPASAPDDPEALNRLAARDRAYQLLSTLTKLGAGWDSSEAWFALARAYEESGQVEKAKEVLWWCVELEDTRPLRRWGCVAGGGYVL